MDNVKEIEQRRTQIRVIAIKKIFVDRGGKDFSSINTRDLSELFTLYDQIFFDNQISDRVKQKDMLTKFYITLRRTGSCGKCGLNGRIVYMEIAPIVLGRYANDGIPNLPFRDILELLMITIEQNIIYILFILWGYYTSIRSENILIEETYTKVRYDKIYGVDGLLFKCMLKEWFNRTYMNTNLIKIISVVSVVGITGNGKGTYEKTIRLERSKGKIPKSSFENWSNSCYIDSVLMSMFANISPFWIDVIRDTDPDKIEYKSGICDVKGGSPIDTEAKLRNHLRIVRRQLLEDYNSIISGEVNIACTNIRTLLALCIPSMKPRGRWDIFNSGALYEGITSLFSSLLMDIPRQLYTYVDGSYKVGAVENIKEASLTMWDFMDPLDNVDKSYKKIRWDSLKNEAKSKILVFNNGGTPRIKRFNEEGEENGIIYISGKPTRFQVTKARAFGERILDDTYTLTAVITLHGVSPNTEGGSHYTAHILGEDREWYFYNDVGSVFEKVDSLPIRGVWREEAGSMPAMYFYVRSELL